MSSDVRHENTYWLLLFCNHSGEGEAPIFDISEERRSRESKLEKNFATYTHIHALLLHAQCHSFVSPLACTSLSTAALR